MRFWCGARFAVRHSENIYHALLKLTFISCFVLLKIQNAYSVHQTPSKFAHVAWSALWIRLWKYHAPVDHIEINGSFLHNRSLEQDNGEMFVPPSVCFVFLIDLQPNLERKRAGKTDCLVTKHWVLATSSKGHDKGLPCQQIFVLHVYCGPFLCGWQLSTS